MTGNVGLDRSPLPAYLTRFIGRDQELQELRRWLHFCGQGAPDGVPGAGSRLLTLSGMGGSGKTRLALELVRPVDGTQRNGVAITSADTRWVSLASVTESQDVPRVVGAAWGSALARSTDPIGSVILHVGALPALLVLDNCEHLLPACRGLVERLLTSCPLLTVLTTSRQPLEVTGEIVFAVPPLRSCTRPASGDAEPDEAVRLFLDRAAIVAPALVANATDEHCIAAICRRLEGLPLAIELAASWMRVITPTDLLAEIDHGIAVLSSTLASQEERHRSMAVVLDSSWQRLSAADRQVLGALAVFAADFSRQAAVTVAGATLSSLSELVGRSLIQRRPEAGTETRYHLHELVRQHARQHSAAEDPGRLDQVRLRHLEYFVQLVERAEGAWDTAEEQQWLDRLRRDEPNVTAALAWALHEEQVQYALRLTSGLFAFWIYTSPPESFRSALEQALDLDWDRSCVETTRARARTLNVAGYAANMTAQYGRSLELFGEGLRLSTELGDDSAVAWSLRGLSMAHRFAGHVSLSLADEERSLAICEAIGDLPGRAWSIYDLGEIAFAAGDLARAEALLGSGLELFELHGIRFGAYRAIVMLADVGVRQGRWLSALSRYTEALAVQRRNHFVARGADILEGLGQIAIAWHEPDRAALLLGAAETWRETSGWAMDVPHGEGIERARALARRQLTVAEWSASWTAGLRLTPELACDEAARCADDLSRVVRAQQTRVTRRERDVLRALALGLSNAEIATQLVLSRRTVHAHVRSIFGKLEVSTRTAAARRAAELHLV